MNQLETNIEPLRAHIALTKAQLRTAREQGLSRAEAGDLIAEQVTTWSAIGRQEVENQVRRAAHRGDLSDLLRVDLPITSNGVNVHRDEKGNISGASTGMPDDPAPVLALGPILAAVLGEKTLAAFLGSMVADLPEGLPAVERQTRISDLSRELHDLQSREAQIMFDAEDEGRPIDPRADQDPRYLLLEGFAS